MIDLHEMARHNEDQVTGLIFESMGTKFFSDPGRKPEVDGKSEVTLIVDGVELPVRPTVEFWVTQWDRCVENAAERLLKSRFVEIAESIQDAEEAAVECLRQCRKVAGWDE